MRTTLKKFDKEPSARHPCILICFAPRVGVRSFSLYHMSKPLVPDYVLGPSNYQSGTIRQAGQGG